jgi:hypothetical protein
MNILLQLQEHGEVIQEPEQSYFCQNFRDAFEVHVIARNQLQGTLNGLKQHTCIFNYSSFNSMGSDLKESRFCHIFF